MKKIFMTLALTAAMAASMGMTAFAGQWVQNTTGIPVEMAGWK